MEKQDAGCYCQSVEAQKHFGLSALPGQIRTAALTDISLHTSTDNSVYVHCTALEFIMATFPKCYMYI